MLADGLQVRSLKDFGWRMLWFLKRAGFDFSRFARGEFIYVAPRLQAGIFSLQQHHAPIHSPVILSGAKNLLFPAFGF